MLQAKCLPIFHTTVLSFYFKLLIHKQKNEHDLQLICLPVSRDQTSWEQTRDLQIVLTSFLRSTEDALIFLAGFDDSSSMKGRHIRRLTSYLVSACNYKTRVIQNGTRLFLRPFAKMLVFSHIVKLSPLYGTFSHTVAKSNYTGGLILIATSTAMAMPMVCLFLLHSIPCKQI